MIRSKNLGNGLTRSVNYSDDGIAVDSKNPSFGYFFNAVYGVDMNQNGSFSGTPDDVYLENTEWTTSAITGNWNFASSTQAQSGSVSISGTLTSDGDIAQIKRSSSIDLSNYESISGYIYVTASDVNDDIFIYAWDTVAGQIVGNIVSVFDYIRTSILNQWIEFIIPISDMGLSASSIDTIRLEVSSASPPFKFYIDTLKIQESGGNLRYRIEPSTNSVLHVQQFKLYLRATGEGKYDMKKFLGLSLLSPIVFRVGISGTVLPAGNFLGLGDLLLITPATFQLLDDGVNSNFFVNFNYSTQFVLNSRTGDFIDILINDDFSSLDLFNVTYWGNTYLI